MIFENQPFSTLMQEFTGTQEDKDKAHAKYQQSVIDFWNRTPERRAKGIPFFDIPTRAEYHDVPNIITSLYDRFAQFRRDVRLVGYNN